MPPDQWEKMSVLIPKTSGFHCANIKKAEVNVILL